MRALFWLVCVTLLGAAVSGCSRSHIPLRKMRSSRQDLAVTGVASGTRFIRYEDLSRLPQVSYTVRNDDNFDGPVQLSGVPLDELISQLGLGGKQLVAAICTDGYEGHYTAEYRALHHPFLALRMSGAEPAKWPLQEDGSAYGPYLISHPSFTPGFHVLAHQDEAQIPTAVIELRFYDEDTELEKLRPQGDNPAAMQGYQIMLQNCLRCHRGGDIGGTKSPYKFLQLSAVAKGKPESFGKYIVRPNSVNPEANMPANPGYDAATIAALAAYFQNVGAK